MKLRVVWITGLLVLAALPATAVAGTSIDHRLHRAEVALGHAQDAADNGNDAGTVAGLRGAVRQTRLAEVAASRLVAHDRDSAPDALAAVTDQQDSNAQTAMDLLDGASAPVVSAVATTLAATDAGRTRVLALVRSLGDTESDWGDQLSQMADDAAGELASAADNLDGDSLSPTAEAALAGYVSHETATASALVAELVSINAADDAALDGDLLDTLSGDLSDAVDALGSINGLSTGAAGAIAAAAAQAGTVGDAVSALSDAVNGADSSGDWSGDTSGIDWTLDS